MSFLVFDASLDAPPPRVPAPAAPAIPFVGPAYDPTAVPAPHPLDASPVSTVAGELCRQLDRVAAALNSNIIATQDAVRQIKAVAREIERAGHTALGPTMAAPSLAMLQAQASVRARGEFSTSSSYAGELSQKDIARFWAKVAYSADHWIWRGMVDRKTGRGQVRIGTKLIYAHRLAYTLHTGRALEGENLKSTCSERMCIRPQHHRPGALGARFDPVPAVSPLPEDLALEEAALAPFGVYVSAADLARSVDMTPYAKDQWGNQALCRRGHKMTVQPGGRRTCRTCDLERKRKSLNTQTQINQLDRERRQDAADLTTYFEDAATTQTTPDPSLVDPVASDTASPTSPYDEFLSDLPDDIPFVGPASPQSTPETPAPETQEDQERDRAYTAALEQTLENKIAGLRLLK